MEDLDPEIAAVSGCKRVPGMRQVLETLGYDDLDGLSLWEHGVSTVGVQALCPVFDQASGAAQMRTPKSVLKSRAQWKLETAQFSTKDVQKLWSATLERVPRHLEGPYTVDEVPFERWASGKRFLREDASGAMCGLLFL